MVDSVVGTPGAVAATDQQLVNYPILWSTWDQVFDSDASHLDDAGAKTTWAQWNPFKDLFSNYTLILPGRATSPRPLSIQLRPGDKTFKTFHPGPHKLRDVVFQWDGKAPDGWTFEHIVPGGGQPPKSTIPHAMCNSDRIAPLVPYLSNSGKSELAVQLEVEIDGVRVSNMGVKLPPGSNWPAPINDPDLDFAQHPLAPGPHVLTVRGTAGAQTDESSITFSMHPAVVSAVSASRPDPEHVKLTWAANPEEAAHGRKIAYEIRRANRPTRNAHRLVKRVAPGTYEAELELSPEDAKQKWFYSVWAVDETTKLVSIDARPVEAKDEVSYFPLRVGTELAYTYTFSIPKMPAGMRFTMTEVMTVPREGLMKSKVLQETRTKELDATMNITVDRKFDRVGSGVHFGDADVISAMRAMSKRKGKRQTANLRVHIKTTQTRPAVLITGESELRKRKGWDNDSAGSTRIVDVSGDAPEVGKIDMKTLSASMPGFDASSQGLAGFTTQGKVEVAGFERVKVPGGTFDDCVKLVMRSSTQGVTVTVWLAPNVGPVKQTQTIQGPKEIGNLTITKVLSKKPKLPQ